MKTASRQELEEIREIYEEMMEQFREVRSFILTKLEGNERDLFKYRCLANCEPGLNAEDSNWVGGGSVDGLDQWINKLEEAYEDLKESEEDQYE